MIEFRNMLMAAENAPPGNKNAWEALNVQLIRLSQTLRAETPPPPLTTSTAQ